MWLFWQVDVPSHFVGLVLENCNLPYANHGHVILGDPSPILFYPISSTEIRCLVDVPGQKLPSLGSGEMARYLKTVVAPQVPTIYVCLDFITVNSFQIMNIPHIQTRYTLYILTNICFILFQLMRSARIYFFKHSLHLIG